MAISFNQISPNTRVPWAYVEFDNSNAMQGPALQPYHILAMGQKLEAGTVAAATPTRVSSASQAGEFFGVGSMLQGMVTALLANNNFTALTVVALDDPAEGVAAEGTLVVTGPATASGTVALYVAGRRFSIPVASGDTGNDIATAIAAEINDDATLPVTAAAVTGTVTVTARHAGVIGNDIDIRLNYYSGEALPGGVGIAITAMAGGAGDVDIADAWAAVGDEQYNVVAMPYTDSANLAAMEAELADRFGPYRQIDGYAFAAKKGTYGELATFGQSRNSEFVSVMAATGSPSPAYEWAAAISGMVAYYGNIDPARPFQTLEIKGVLAPDLASRFSFAENNNLLFDGIATHSVDAGGRPRVQRLITTYQTNAFGADDTSYLDVNTLLTLSYLRYDFRNYFLRKYPRHKLANDGTRFGAGQAIMTPKIGKAEAIAKFRDWEELGLVEGIEQFKRDLIVERNAQDPNRLDFLLPPDLINQLRVVGAQIQFLL